jgi:hypothetical protein
MGDLNYPGINRDTWSNKANSEDQEYKFIESIRDCYLYEECMISSIDIEAPLGKSDHSVLNINFQCSISLNTKQDTIRFCYD